MLLRLSTWQLTDSFHYHLQLFLCTITTGLWHKVHFELLSFKHHQWSSLANRSISLKKCIINWQIEYWIVSSQCSQLTITTCQPKFIDTQFTFLCFCFYYYSRTLQLFAWPILMITLNLQEYDKANYSI